MTKLKKPIDYIDTLCSSLDPERRSLGELLHRQYHKWTRSLLLEDLLTFMQSIQDHKEKIGAPQLFGKFRAYSLEEFVYRLIRSKVRIPKTLGIYWGEKCLLWRRHGRNYGMELDILIGRKVNEFIQPRVAIDTKVELDASRLKTALASFTLLKQEYPKAKCFLVYITKQANPILLELTKPWIDRAFQLSQGQNDAKKLVESVQAAIEMADEQK